MWWRGFDTRWRAICRSGPRNPAIGFGALLVASLVSCPWPVFAGELVKVRYAEIARSLFYAPVYLAIADGIFRNAGLEVSLRTSYGDTRSTNWLDKGQVDIALQSPETAIFLRANRLRPRLRMFAALTATDGFFLVGRIKADRRAFSWAALKGKRILGWRPGSLPALSFRYALRNTAVPASAVRMEPDIPIPRRFSAWLNGKADYALFHEPDVSRLERTGAGTAVASIGEALGRMDYTVFVATESFILRNAETIKRWRGAVDTALNVIRTRAPARTAESISSFFRKASAADLERGIRRYLSVGAWKQSPDISAKSVVKLQDILIDGGRLRRDRRVNYADIVHR